MWRLEVSAGVRHIYMSLGFKRLKFQPPYKGSLLFWDFTQRELVATKPRFVKSLESEISFILQRKPEIARRNT